MIETILTALRRATLEFSYKISRKNGDLLLAEGSTRHACVDREGKATKISPALQSALKAALSPNM